MNRPKSNRSKSIKTWAAALCFAGSIAEAASAQTCPRLVGHWRFDGNTLDSSGFHNDGTFLGSVAHYVPGIAGQALELDGFSDFVRVANHPSLNPANSLTLAAWVKPRTFHGIGSHPIIDKGFVAHSAPYYQYHLDVTGDAYPSSPATMGVSVATGGTWTFARSQSSSWLPGNWYFAVGTYDGFFVRFYFNGELVQTSPAAMGSVSDYGTSVLFGKFNNLDYYLPATIDEIRIFDRALSVDEIRAHYFDPASATAIWPRAASVCVGGTASFQVLHLASSGASYQWSLDGQPIADGILPNGVVISGSTTSTLQMSNVVSGSTYSVGCTVNTCSGIAGAVPAIAKSCQADFTCDGQVDDADFVGFVAAYNILDCADPTMPATCPADLNGDGFVDDSDFVLFVHAYNELGCL